VRELAKCRRGRGWSPDPTTTLVLTAIHHPAGEGRRVPKLSDNDPAVRGGGRPPTLLVLAAMHMAAGWDTLVDMPPSATPLPRRSARAHGPDMAFGPQGGGRGGASPALPALLFSFNNNPDFPRA